MSETKWTPGPWRNDYLPQHRQRITASNGNVSICDIALWTADYAEQLANSALIAAAPELYEALKRIEWGAEDRHQEPTCPACMRSRTIGHHDGCSVDAALATAEGRS